MLTVLQSVYYDKTSEFATSTKSSLPIIAVDLPLPLLSRLTLHPEWVSDDEPFKSILASLATSERKYADTVREGVRKLVKEDGCGVFWLFGVREGRVSRSMLMFCTTTVRLIDGSRGF